MRRVYNHAKTEMDHANAALAPYNNQSAA
jgi:hypothetical protein